MEQVVERLWALRHEPEGPLLPYLDLFARVLDEQGFKRRVLRPQIRLVANFSRWLQARQITAAEVSDEQVRRFIDEVVPQRSTQRGDLATLRRFMDFLHQLGVIHPLPEHDEAAPIERAVQAFATYLRQERALSDRTLIQYCPFIGRFLSERFGSDTISFAALRASDVIAFIQRQAAQLSPARAKAATTALRSFLRYLRYCGEIQLDLAAAVPSVPNWSMTGIPAPSHRSTSAPSSLIARISPRSDAVTMRFCCCWRVWACARAKSFR
jgi:integrase/recombinase XerD